MRDPNRFERHREGERGYGYGADESRYGGVRPPDSYYAGHRAQAPRSFNDRWANAYGGQTMHRPYEERDARRGPRGFQRSDQRIYEEVCERLTDDPYVDASNIEVRVQDGEVTLTGTVNTREEKRHAENVIETIGGVNDVHNTLRIERAQSEWDQRRQWSEH